MSVRRRSSTWPPDRPGRWQQRSTTAPTTAPVFAPPEFEEIDPLSADEVDAIAEELGPSSGALVIFAAETGLRTKRVDRPGAP
jgi:hypothetical protein